MRNPILWRLLWWPAVITFAVTTVRLAGELLGWSSVFFSRSVGGGGAVVGISGWPQLAAAYGRKAHPYRAAA